MQRRLAAILSADAAGVSRLMGDDDSATVRSLDTCRQLVGGIVAAHQGRVVDTPGDNLLADFGSAVEAVEAACAMQAQLGSCNAELPEHRCIAFRIGVNLGDGRLYDDGVNIAARLELRALPGGICVSGKVLTELWRFHELFVISRNTSFKCKGQTVDVNKVARELGVQ